MQLQPLEHAAVAVAAAEATAAEAAGAAAVGAGADCCCQQKQPRKQSNQAPAVGAGTAWEAAGDWGSEQGRAQTQEYHYQTRTSSWTLAVRFHLQQVVQQRHPRLQRAGQPASWMSRLSLLGAHPGY